MDQPMDEGSHTTDERPLEDTRVEGKGVTAPHNNHQVKKLDEAYFGYGDHADVYRGRLDGKKLVAIKQLRGVNSNKTDIRDSLRSGLHEQFDTQWSHLNHPNVCRVHLIVDNFGFLPALVLDYFPKGSLIQYIDKNNPSYEQRIRWVFEISEALAYLHLLNVYHGDLRCANVFVNDINQAVIADYGIAQYFSNSDFTSAKSTGTVRWTGPEVICLLPNPNARQDKLDIFAFGMTMLEVFSGKPPFEGKSDTGAILSIPKHESPKLPENISGNDNLRDLFERCTRKDPRERPPAQEVAKTLEPLVPPQGIMQSNRKTLISFLKGCRAD